MATTRINWNVGEGAITATYNGSGNGSAAISSDVNEGIDRAMVVSVATTAGSPVVERSVTVNQAGLREVFTASDGDFILADGGTFNVLKE